MSGFDEVVHLRGEDLRNITAELVRAVSNSETVRLAIDEGGMKIAVGRWSWTPAVGEVEEVLQ